MGRADLGFVAVVVEFTRSHCVFCVTGVSGPGGITACIKFLAQCVCRSAAEIAKHSFKSWSVCVSCSLVSF